MPFQSEKQRRFLWAEHPEIAKRWAHEYPESNKGLPMYADKKKTTNKDETAKKAAALNVLHHAVSRLSGVNLAGVNIGQDNTRLKASMDKLERVDIPHSDRPTYAGEEREEGEQKTDENNKTEQDAVSAPDSADMGDSDRAKTLLSKLSAVLSRPYREMMEAQQAQAEAREPRFVPQNLGLRKYSLPSPAVMPPMGMMSAPQNASAAQGAQAAQQNLPQPSQGPVGGGSNPQHNPIQAFGPLGAKGQLNGNAAFGQKHSPDSLKTAGWKDIFGARKSQPGWYGPEGLVEVQGGGYRYGHTHGVDVLDEPPGWLRRIFDRDPYVLRADVPKYKRQLKAIKGMTVSETPDRLEFSHMGQLKPEMRQLIEAALAKHSSAKNTALAALTSMESRSILDDDETELAHKQAKTQACSCGCGDTVTTCKCASSCSCRKPGGSCHKTEKEAKQLGLWDRIRAKRQRGETAAKPGDKDYPDAKSWNKVTEISDKKAGATPAWQRSEGKNEEGGLNEAGRKSYEREHGGDLKPPVTESNPSGERKKRQNSFCSRMCGMKRVNTGAKTKNDPDSRINKSLRKWNCKCSSARDLINIALGQAR